MKLVAIWAWVLGALCALAGHAAALDMPTVHVGNTGNVNDTDAPQVGAVDYHYRIAVYEVTAGQYCEFLNAVATTDTYGLYTTKMDVDGTYFNARFGANIKRTGDPGSYVYTVAPDWANRPVNFMSWGDTVRFANWMHNGQPTGAQDLTTTEDGAYYLNGASTDPELMAVTRKAGWKWALPTEDEWYKAAYHKNDGDTGNYYDYATRSDVLPNNSATDPDPGNSATYSMGGYTIGPPYIRTEVGAHENSASPYGTYDQTGNLYEWIESTLINYSGNEYRIRRGGFFRTGAYPSNLGTRSYGDPSNQWEYIETGFRLVEAYVPADGDTNFDDVVDAADYITVKRNFGAGPGAAMADGDVSDGTGPGQDGLVNGADLSLVAGELNAAAPAAPELASAVLLMLGAGWLVRRRRG